MSSITKVLAAILKFSSSERLEREIGEGWGNENVLIFSPPPPPHCLIWPSNMGVVML